MKNNVLIRLLPYFQKYKWILFLDLIAASLSSICDLVLPMMVRHITNLATQDLLTLKIAATVCLYYLLLQVLNVIGKYYMTSIGHIMGSKIETDMRYSLFEHLQKMSYSYFNDSKTGQLIARFTSDLFDITEFSHHFPEEAFLAVLKSVIAFIVLSQINLELTIYVFLMLPFLSLLLLYFNKKMHKATKASRVQIGEINGQVEDSLLGIRVVKSFANEQTELNNFQKGNLKFLDIKKSIYYSIAGLNSSSFFFQGLMEILVIFLGSWFIIQGKITAGDLIAYILYSFALFYTVARMVEFSESFQKGYTAAERFFEVIDTEPEMQDKPDAIECIQPKGAITFENVSFKYPENEEMVLKNITLTVRPGQNIALVGPSGSGKTTFCSLIPRFYDPTEGRILLDGHDLRDFTQGSLRRSIGSVQQDVYLFDGSIYDNIIYGKPDATKEEIIAAAKMADAHEFITSFPEGYDTYIGERGVKLSGGQKQRISIARVFLKNPPILILDEATSALDNQSEKMIQASLDILAKNRTTFTIAHRLSTIHKADLILVLTEKGIEEKGSHDELMQKKGVYYQLYTMANLSTK